MNPMMTVVTMLTTRDLEGTIFEDGIFDKRSEERRRRREEEDAYRERRRKEREEERKKDHVPVSHW